MNFKILKLVKAALALFTMLASLNGNAANSAQDLLDLPMINLKSALQSEKGLEASAKGFWTVVDDKNENWVKRWKAIVAAGKIEGVKSSEKLKTYTNDSNWFLRSGSMVSASQFDLSVAKDIARKLINDKALMVRSQAVHILSTKLEDSDRAILWNELKEKRNFRSGQSLWLRSQILTALSQEPKKDEISEWKNLIQEKDSKIKIIVSKASQQLGLF